MSPRQEDSLLVLQFPLPLHWGCCSLSSSVDGPGSLGRASSFLPKTKAGPSGSAVCFTRSTDPTLPFDGLEPSREIAGRRSSVLRRLAMAKKPAFLVSTVEAIMERLPPPTGRRQLSIALKFGDRYDQEDLQRRLERLGWDIEEEAGYPRISAVSRPSRYSLQPRSIRSGSNTRKGRSRTFAVDPRQHNLLFEASELVVDPMSELGDGG